MATLPQRRRTFARAAAGNAAVQTAGSRDTDWAAGTLRTGSDQ